MYFSNNDTDKKSHTFVCVSSYAVKEKKDIQQNKSHRLAMPPTENIHILQQHQESALLRTENNQEILQHNMCHVYLNLHKNYNIYRLIPQGLYSLVSL